VQKDVKLVYKVLTPLEIISKNYMLEFMLDAIELVVFEHFDA
jgi:hypothetical protein